MASIAVATLVAAVGATAMSAVSAREQGIAQADDAKMRANQAKLEAGQKQIQIRQNMLKALATQNAAAGQAGVGTGGSFGANVKRQIDQNQNDLLALNANTSSQVQQYDAQASNAVATGNANAVGSVLSQGKSLLDQGASVYGKLTAPAAPSVG